MHTAHDGYFTWVGGEVWGERVGVCGMTSGVAKKCKKAKHYKKVGKVRDSSARLSKYSNDTEPINTIDLKDRK